MLLDAGLNMVDSLTFGAQTQNRSYSRIPNGTGGFVIKSPTFLANNESLSGVEEQIHPPSFSVYPNPAQNQVQVSVAAPAAGTYIEIYNAVGQRISGILSAEQVSVDVSSLARGVYFVRCGTETKRLVLVK